MEVIQENAVLCRNLTVGFGPRIVLNQLSLDVRRGEILGLVGGSGSGKSVLMRTIIGLVAKRTGTVEIFGNDINRLDNSQRRMLDQRWGVLFQHGALFSSMNVLENVQFPMREVLEVSPALMRDIALVKLELVGLDVRDAMKRPAELSGGMTKRAALARALALDPELVFLDEPTSGLDPISAGEFDDLLLTLKETLGLTVFMVTHDLEVLHSVCDRIAVLADGQVVVDGSIDTLMTSDHPWVHSYFHGRRSQRLLDRVARLPA